MAFLRQLLRQGLHYVLVTCYQADFRNCLHVAKTDDLAALFRHPQPHDRRPVTPAWNAHFTFVPKELRAVYSYGGFSKAFFLLIPQFQDVWEISANRVAPSDVVHL